MRTASALIAVSLAVTSIAHVALGGGEAISSKEMKQSVAMAPECFYRDSEINVSIWGAYAFTDTGNDRSNIEDADDLDIYGTYDRFLGDDSWGGGIDVKYFFRKYFGVGIEGFALDGNSQHAILDHGSQAQFEERYDDNEHLVGAVLGTFTLRFPIGCSRFSPYVWGGGGGIFNGRNDHAVGRDAFFPTSADRFDNSDESKFIGQFGGGIEIRLTRHIGLLTDFSWNVLDGPHNNFGMFRGGVNFAF